MAMIDIARFIALTLLVMVGFTPDSDAASHVIGHWIAIQAKGHQLRKEIGRTPVAVGYKGEDISRLVYKYIPVGTPFDHAEDILRAAGFSIGRREVLRGSRRWGEAASMQSAGLFSTVLVEIDLFPTAPDDYRAVGAVTANKSVISNLP